MSKCTCAFPCGQTEPTCPSSPEYGTRVLHRKTYSEDELSDLERDIYECIDPAYNSKAAGLSEDGVFVVTVEWKPC